MTHSSPAGLLTLHALRLTGMATTGAVASRFAGYPARYAAALAAPSAESAGRSPPAADRAGPSVD